MADLSPDQQILNQIAALLGSIAPAGATEVLFHAKIYDDANQGVASWVDGDGTRQMFTRKTAPPMAITRQLLDLIEQLQTTPAFANSPFTQAEIRLTRTPSITIDTANIPFEDSWFGLYMRPLSALTWDDAQALNVPRDAWEARQPG